MTRARVPTHSVRLLVRSCAATAAQRTAFLLAKDIPTATTQPLRIAFTCPRKLDNQLRDYIAGRSTGQDTAQCLLIIIGATPEGRNEFATQSGLRCDFRVCENADLNVRLLARITACRS
jgi:hypothetical protein